MGSKAREGVKAMSLAFVLLDFQHAAVRRRAVVYETECRHAAVQRGNCVLLDCESLIHVCRFYSVVCYSCVTTTFSFEWNKEATSFGLHYVKATMDSLRERADNILDIPLHRHLGKRFIFS